MQRFLKLSLAVLVFGIMSCGGSENDGGSDASSSGTTNSAPDKTEEAAPKTDSNVPASERVDLENKGIGPITNVELGEEIDRKMAVKGKEIYDTKCIACHSVDTKLIGPPQKGILERRTPEWVMNMIMNPTEMLEKDPLAKDLLEEFNNTPMLDQNISEDEARALVEYFRTL